MQQDDDHDSDELRHNCHSDAESNLDSDPNFEYNKCHQISFLEKKCESRLHKFYPLQISTFGLPSPIFNPPKPDIVSELDNLVRLKFYQNMQQYV